MRKQRGLGPALAAGAAVLFALIGLMFASVAAAQADAEDPAAARRTPTPSDTPTATLTPVPTVEAAATAAPTATEGAPAAQADELVTLFNDLQHLVISRYPDGSISFWRAHPDLGSWGFVAWLDAAAQPGPAGAVVIDAADEGWRLTVQRIDECGGPSPAEPADPADWHFYVARVIARMMCDGRPMYYVWLTDPTSARVTEGSFVP